MADTIRKNCHGICDLVADDSKVESIFLEPSRNFTFNPLYIVALMVSPCLVCQVNVKVPVAQWIARWTSNPKVPGSNPGWDDSFSISY